MRLLIDAGNTRIKWAIVDEQIASSVELGQWPQFGSVSHAEFSSGNVPWQGLSSERVLVSNVAGLALREQLEKTFNPQHGQVSWFQSQAQHAGLSNRYREPSKLGSDRFASAIAAHTLFPNRHLIVATCGTATTIDAVTAQGEFIGGQIAPGLQLMAQSLAQNTAQLPSVLEQMNFAVSFADHTEAAIISGCLAAQAGAIERAVREFAKQLDSAILPLCVISGGAAKYITPILVVPYQFIDNLVLMGLQAASC
jgi:type III pantothenate kinase